MSCHNRLIPVIQIENRRLVKTVRFKPKRYLGDPLNAVRIFNLKEVNELIVVDIGATETRIIDFTYLEKLTSQSFVPLVYGGGVHSIEDVHRLYQIGFDRIIFGTAVVENPNLIKDVAKVYGNQSIICSLDVSKRFFGHDNITCLGGRKILNLSRKEYVKQCIDLGAGEILLHDKFRDGTYSGLNTKLIKEVASYSSLPIIVSGGAKSMKDALDALSSGASAVAIGSLYSFYGPHKAVLINYRTY